MVAYLMILQKADWRRIAEILDNEVGENNWKLFFVRGIHEHEESMIEIAYCVNTPIDLEEKFREEGIYVPYHWDVGQIDTWEWVYNRCRFKDLADLRGSLSIENLPPGVVAADYEVLEHWILANIKEHLEAI